jgi:hypothetical protein
MFEPIRRRSLEANAPLLEKLDVSRAEDPGLAGGADKEIGLAVLASSATPRRAMQFGRKTTSAWPASRSWAVPSPTVLRKLPPESSRTDISVDVARQRAGVAVGDHWLLRTWVQQASAKRTNISRACTS